LIILKKKYSNDDMTEWGQTFRKYDYKDLIETGTMLEDAVYSTAPLSFNGRFNNHFYDAQNNGHALTLGYGIRVNSLKWAINGTHVGSFIRKNKYSNYNAHNYYLQSIGDPSPIERRKYQAKLLVSVGHLLHLMNDLTSPAHVRDDSHPFGDAMEEYGRGGDDGSENIGYKIKGNSLDDDVGIVENQATNIPKYSKFSDFITKEATWTATHFFSKDTIFTKPKPSISDTYESFASSNGGIDKYYIRSYGNGTSNCRNGCVPGGTKLGIKIKSYITRGLKRYYTGSSENLLLDKSTSFQGDYTVLKENAKILIPRAIANARNFINYFFRGQISAEITYTTIVVKNISDTSLVAKDATIMRSTHSSGGAYSFRYEDDDGTRHPLYFTYDRSAGNSDFNDNTTQPNSPTNVLYPTIDLDSGDSLEAHIILDDASKRIIRTKKIIAIYYGDIGQEHEKGVAVCQVSRPEGITGTRD